MPTMAVHFHINLRELKAKITDRVGPERAHRYFSYLDRFLSQKLSKSEFDKLCSITLGRGNIRLHNHLLRSIIKNACQAKVSAVSVHNKDGLRSVGEDGKISPSAEDGYPPSTAGFVSDAWSNGNKVPTTYMCAAGVQDRKPKDRASLLGLNGSINGIPHHSSVLSYDTIMKENGFLVPCDLKGQEQHHQAGTPEQLSKRPRVDKPPRRDQFLVQKRSLDDVAVTGGCENVQQAPDAYSSRGPLQAPLGIPFCPASLGGSCRPLPLGIFAGSTNPISNSYSGELFHTDDLKTLMDQIAQAQGLAGVTLDSANLLNNGLDCYLKRLVKSCVDLVGARSGYEPIRQRVYKQQFPGKSISGTWQGNNMHAYSNSRPIERPPEGKNHPTISLLDFKVAMELNPQQLGEDWPLLLEKICVSSLKNRTHL